MSQKASQRAACSQKGLSPLILTVILAVTVIVALLLGTLLLHAAVHTDGSIAAYAQEYYDTEPTLVAYIIEDSKHVFRDDSGYGVMAGMVENRGPAHISEIRIQVSFYDSTGSTLLNVVSDAALVDVLPPYSKAPFLIKSSVPEPSIEQASARVIYFDSAPVKEPSLRVGFDVVESYVIENDYTNIVLSGSIKNGPAPSSDAVIYVALHDVFEPPRTLDVKAVHIGDMEPGEAIQFDLDEVVSSDVRSLSVYAESDIYYSDSRSTVRSPIPSEQNTIRLLLPAGSTYASQQSTLRVEIADVALYDDVGMRTSSVFVGEYVTIQSNILIDFEDVSMHDETSYVIYAKVRDASESGSTEFVGMSMGRITDQDGHMQIIEWTPQNPGFYMVETFVWDDNGVPIAERGPVLLVLVGE